MLLPFYYDHVFHCGNSVCKLVKKGDDSHVNQLVLLTDLTQEELDHEALTAAIFRCRLPTQSSVSFWFSDAV